MIVASDRDNTLDMKLTPGGRPITGTVTDRTGGPVAGALVEVTQVHGFFSARDRRSVVAALTDEAGT